MSVILSGSEEGYNTDLDIFSVPDTETGIQERYEKIYKPVVVYTGQSVVTFRIENASEDYIDVHNIQLLLDYQIYTDKNVSWDSSKGDFCGPINLATGTFFTQCDFELNHINLNSGIGKLYPYKAYIYTILNSGLDKNHSYLPASGYEKDYVSSMDDETGEHNISLKKRAAWSDAGKTARLTGKLYSDFTDQTKYLIRECSLCLG